MRMKLHVNRLTEAIHSNISQIAVHLNKHKQQYDSAKVLGTA
jgi:hypothetical protein